MLPHLYGMPLEQISAMPVLSNVVYYGKERNMFHFSSQPKMHLQHLGKTCTERTIVLGKNNMVKKIKKKLFML